MRYFTQKDFDNCNPPCKIGDMNEHFMKRLDRARHSAGVPFVVNSAYRTKEHELSRGRNGTSSHVKGIAIDIRARSSRERFLILSSLIEEGFHRIGIGRTFIHVDQDTEKDDEVSWLY